MAPVSYYVMHELRDTAYSNNYYDWNHPAPNFENNDPVSMGTADPDQ